MKRKLVNVRTGEETEEDVVVPETPSGPSTDEQMEQWLVQSDFGRLMFEALFTTYNEAREGNGKQALTKQQFRTALKSMYESL